MKPHLAILAAVCVLHLGVETFNRWTPGTKRPRGDQTLQWWTPDVSVHTPQWISVARTPELGTLKSASDTPRFRARYLEGGR